MKAVNPSAREGFGFSLVEIAMALVIISFSLVALLGLLSTSLSSARQSEDDTRLAAMSRQVIEVLRSRPLPAIPFTDPTEAGTTTPAVLNTVYFDSEGIWLAPEASTWPAASAVRPEGAMYACTVVVEPVAAQISPPPPTGTATPAVTLRNRVNLVRAQLVFDWPGQPPSKPLDLKPSDTVFHATLPRF